MPFLIKLSTLLIISQFVWNTHQFKPCIATTKVKPSDEYTFALAQVDDYKNLVGPQEACYYSCGAQVVTQSVNRGDFAQLTLMDNAASFLTSSGFLKIGESYYLNHLGMTDEEGGNGIGCIEVKPGNRINHYPKKHVVCSMAKAAICGFFGQQTIPAQPVSSTIPQLPSSILPPVVAPPVSSSSALVKPPTSSPQPAVPTKRPSRSRKPPVVKSTTSTASKPVLTSSIVIPPSSSLVEVPIIPTSIVVLPFEPASSSSEELTSTLSEDIPLTTSTLIETEGDLTTTALEELSLTSSTYLPESITELAEILSELETLSDIFPVINEPIVSSPVVELPVTSIPAIDPISQIPVGPVPTEQEELDTTFKVKGRRYNVINKFEDSLAAAGITCKENQGNIATVTSDSYQDVATNVKDTGKVIIGAWNGDNYSLAGNDCLILESNIGIFTGTCADASAILCQI